LSGPFAVTSRRSGRAIDTRLALISWRVTRAQDIYPIGKQGITKADGLTVIPARVRLLESRKCPIGTSRPAFPFVESRKEG
jgi:hypothetical protein